MFRIILTITCLFVYFGASAQFGNERIIAEASSANAERIISADINGDGLNDVIGYSEANDQIFCYENQDNQHYGTKKVLIGNVTSCSGMNAGDLDGDGDLDIVYSGFFAELYWMENLGNDTYTNHLVTGTLDAVFEPQLADLDSDGDQDIFFTVYTGKMGWFSNQGAGTFSNVNYIFQGSPSHIHASLSDQNGDGKLDIVFGIQGDHVVLWKRNTGGGTFANEELLAVVYSVNDVVCGDFDNDGDPDVAASRNSDLFLLENQGDGSIDTLQIIESVGADLHSLNLTDVNNDGQTDVLCLSEYKARWFENNSGDFSNLQIVRDEICEAILASHMDSDTMEDIITDYGNVSVWKNNSGVFDSISFLGTLLTGNQWPPVVLSVSDLNQDGKADIVSQMGNFSWFEGLGNGEFGHQHLMDQRPAGATAMSVGDLDNDGDMDAIGARNEPDRETIAFMNDGTGNFTEVFIDSTDEFVAPMTLADINNDGFLDVLSNAYSFDSSAYLVVLYKNNGNGTFQRVVLENLGQNMVWRELAVKDMDGDGLMDVLFSMNPDFKWLRNLGAGNFAPAAVLGGLPHTTSFEPVDFDQDGDTDLVLVNNYQGIEWYENDGNAVFSMHLIQAPGTPSYSTIHSNDFDLDGDFDMVAATEQTGELVYWENLSDAGFSNAYTFELLGGTSFSIATRITSADLFGSNKPELIYDAGGRIVVMENLTDLGFKEMDIQNPFCYPNPFTDQVQLNLEAGMYDVAVESISGLTVFAQTGYDKMHIDLSAVSPGPYLVSVTNLSTGKRTTRKIIKL